MCLVITIAGLASVGLEELKKGIGADISLCHGLQLLNCVHGEVGVRKGLLQLCLEVFPCSPIATLLGLFQEIVFPDVGMAQLHVRQCEDDLVLIFSQGWVPGVASNVEVHRAHEGHELGAGSIINSRAGDMGVGPGVAICHGLWCGRQGWEHLVYGGTRGKI